MISLHRQDVHICHSILCSWLPCRMDYREDPHFHRVRQMRPRVDHASQVLWEGVHTMCTLFVQAYVSPYVWYVWIGERPQEVPLPRRVLMWKGYVRLVYEKCRKQKSGGGNRTRVHPQVPAIPIPLPVSYLPEGASYRL